ncbi:MAG TPA: D-glycero-beta-D-manno-heptose-7-phosphate kinase [Alphaproteobacteria bacterium]|nr:D-glycero-beta-D-manno-heptose-7-phosphate kinase [Alphaproteobacteria bacterium]
MLDRAGAATVLAVGDLMLDRFISGKVHRISPEAPIPVLAVDRDTSMAGGVGNVVSNVRSLGGRAELVAVVGNDAAAGMLASILEPASGIGLVTDRSRPTAVKERFIAGGQQLLRADYEQVRTVSVEIEDLLIAEIQARLPHAGALVLSDYGKGVLTERVLASAIASAKKRGIPIIVDPKGADYARYRGATAVTPNLKELAEASGGIVSGDEAVVVAARRVIKDAGILAIVATRGGEGLSVVPAKGEVVHVRAEAREVFDVSGAGDTVVATLALALAVGMELGEAATLANLAGGVVVGKVGTAPATAEELRHAADGGRGEGKVVGFAALIERVERWRRRGLKVGFTNGCFDLLHPGHLSLLRQARAASDRLVVGLNSDASVRRLKGTGRPVSDEASRATVLGAVSDVDAVAIFEEDTPIKLIEAIRPDVLIKGADYAVEQIVGADFVLSYGGKVVRAELAPGHSTTATVAKIAADDRSRRKS